MQTLQIAIATKQPLANLLPLLVSPPDKLWLLISEDMRQAADEFVRFIQKVPALATMAVELKVGLPDSPYFAIQEYGVELAAELEQEYENWLKTYNVTGGTKLMAVALTGIFNEKGYRQIYVNTANNQIEEIFPLGQSTELPNLLDTKTYLEAHDVTWRKADSDELQWQQQVTLRESSTLKFAKAIAKAEKANHFLSMLNQQLASAATKKEILNPQIDLSFIPSAFNDVFQSLAQVEFIDYDKDYKRIYLKSMASHRYLSGAWLEEYFYLIAKRAGLVDIHAGIDITDNFDNKKDIRNEIDGAATHANRVLLVECKTSSFGKDQQKDSSIVYKLDSLANQVGGIFHTSLLLSAQPLDHTTSNNRAVYTTARANAADISVIAGVNLLKLEPALKTWMSTGRWPLDAKA